MREEAALECIKAKERRAWGKNMVEENWDGAGRIDGGKC